MNLSQPYPASVSISDTVAGKREQTWLEMQKMNSRKPTDLTSHGIDMTTPLKNSDFPGPFDVICAQGRKAKEHCGNQAFRKKISDTLESYSKAKSKLDKTRIVSNIIASIRTASPHGGFIRQGNDGEWHRVSDHLAREKIGQCFRDLLHSRYKSSTKAKRSRRRRQNENLVSIGAKERRNGGSQDESMDKIEIEAMVRKNVYVNQRMRKLSNELAKEVIEDAEYVTHILTRANLDILEALKKSSKFQSQRKE